MSADSERDVFAEAIVSWVNTCAISRHCDTIEDLSDGTIFYEILAEIDPQWFKLVRSIDTGDNWVLKFNNLKKLYKLLTGYYEEVLGQNTSALDVPNLTSIARDSESSEILKLAQLIVALAVQCEHNQKYIAKIQSLEELSQHALMLAIEQVMERLSMTGGKTISPGAGSPASAVLNEEKALLETENSALREKLRLLQSKYDDLASEKRDLQTGLRDMEQSISELSGAGKVDFMLRTEIDNLKADVERSENKRAEADLQVEQQALLIKEMSKKLEDANKKLEETSRLKDQLDEFRHFADKLQKSEAMIEKYKKKMEEGADLRKQVKTQVNKFMIRQVVETQNAQLLERNRHLEDEYRKLSGFKPLMETYKEQISSMEGKNSSLQVENSKLEFEVKEMKTKLERLELLRKSDHEQMQALEDQVRELELSGDRITGELSSGVPAAESTLGSDLNDSVIANLRARVAQLESEKNTKDQSSDRVAVLETLLDDANRMKEKFEKEYMHAFQKNLSMENEMKQLRSLASSDGQETVDKLRSQISEYQQELTTTKRRLAEAEVAIAQGGGINNGTLPGGPDYEKIKRQLDSFEKESRLQMAQINKLLMEKDILESQNMEMKEGVLQQERAVNDLKAALAAVESKGQSADETTQKLASATQKIVQLTEQNSKLHSALKEAKKHILSQDKQIKDHKAIVPKDNFVEAITSYEGTIREKDAEIDRIKKELNDTRRAAKRELSLVVSAWYSQGVNMQRRNQILKSDGSPSSWLALQRKAAVFNGGR
ncbi:hypothetical protein HDU76_004859 [Blyttiomyces sp. JEL0837]|nr:hypothetical protein HDU76_004859 [Blyttiomyces sp. JEL0837]